MVRVHNTNTGALLKCTVQLSDAGFQGLAAAFDLRRGNPWWTATWRFPGWLESTELGQSFQVPGSAAAVDLDFSATWPARGHVGPEATEGSVTGKLLPTGRLLDVLHVPDLGDLEVTLLDAGHVRAGSLGAQVSPWSSCAPETSLRAHRRTATSASRQTSAPQVGRGV